MGFPRQKYWSGLPFPSPGDLPNPGIEPQSPVLQTDSLPPEPPGKPRPKNKWWRRHTKSPCLTAHVHASLEGRPEAPEALFHLSEGGEGAALAGGAQGQVGVGRGSANSRNPLPRKGGQGPATSSSSPAACARARIAAKCRRNACRERGVTQSPRFKRGG